KNIKNMSQPPALVRWRQEAKVRRKPLFSTTHFLVFNHPLPCFQPPTSLFSTTHQECATCSEQVSTKMACSCRNPHVLVVNHSSDTGRADLFRASHDENG